MSKIFKGVYIPAVIWLDERLSPTHKMLLCEIDAMSEGKENPCIARNQHFATHLGCSKFSIKNMLTFLEKLGYIVRFYGNEKYHTDRKMYTNFSSAPKIKWLENGSYELNYAFKNDEITPSLEDATPVIEECHPRHSEMPPPSFNNATINKPLNQLLNSEEEEEEYLEYVDEFINEITDNLTGIKKPKSYRYKIITALKNKDKKTVQNYNEFVKNYLAGNIIKSKAPIEKFVEIYEETKRIDYAYLESSKGLSFQQQDELKNFKEEFHFKLLTNKYEMKRKIS